MIEEMHFYNLNINLWLWFFLEGFHPFEKLMSAPESFPIEKTQMYLHIILHTTWGSLGNSFNPSMDMEFRFKKNDL